MGETLEQQVEEVDRETRERISNLVEAEQRLQDIPPKPDEEREQEEAEPPFLTAEVIDARYLEPGERWTRSLDTERHARAAFKLERPDGTRFYDAIEWPEYDADDEPLACVLRSAGLDRHRFADVVGHEVPIIPGENGHVIHVPPANGLGNRLAYRLHRSAVKWKIIRYCNSHDRYDPTRRAGFFTGFIPMFVSWGVVEVLSPLTDAGGVSELIAFTVVIPAALVWLVAILISLFTIIAYAIAYGSKFVRMMFPEPH